MFAQLTGSRAVFALLTRVIPHKLRVALMVRLLDHRREGHLQRAGQLGDGRGSAGEPLDHDPPAGVGQGLEYSVELVKQLLKYCTF